MPVKDLIKAAAVKCGKPHAADEFVKVIVEENWLETTDALSALTDEEWAQLKLPLRFTNMLRAELNAVSSCGTAPRTVAPPLAAMTSPAAPPVPPMASPAAAPSQTPPLPERPPLTTTPTEWQADEYEFGYFESGPGPDVDIDVAAAVRSVGTVQSLRTLHKILLNALGDPNDLKKRVLKISNAVIQRDVMMSKGALDVLLAAGFVQVTEGDVERLALFELHAEHVRTVLKYLEREASCRNSPMIIQPNSSRFDPYKSSLVSQAGSTNLFKQANHEEYSPEILKSKIMAELKLRETGGGEHIKVPLNPRYYPAAQRSVARKKLSDGDEAEYASEGPSMSAESLQRLKDILSGNIKFRSTLSNQLVALKRVPIYSKSCLRIIAPDRSYVEMDLKPNSTIRDVYRILWDNHILHDDFKRTQSNYWLIDAPPAPRIDENKTLFNLGLVPNGQLRLGAENMTIYKGPWFNFF